VISFFAFVASVSALAASNPLQLHDPTYYDVLAKGSRLECHYLRGMDTYGLVLQRGDGDLVHVSLVTNGVVEGEKTSFDAAIKSSSLGAKFLQFRTREGKYGSSVEIVIQSRISADVGYGLPGRVMFTTTTYSVDAEGKEQEDTEPEGMHIMSCKPPMPVRQ
jgi:hypothetical protein